MEVVLSVFAYHIEPPVLHKLLDILGDIGRAVGVSYRMEVFTDNITDATAIIRAGEGIALMLLGVDERSKDPNLLSIRLGRLAKQINRDHYVVYVLNNLDPSLVAYCSGAFGIIAPPISHSGCKAVLEHMLTDFKRLFSNDQGSDSWVSFKAKGKAYRVRTEDICFVQAVNKMIEVHTMTQTITLYDKLEALEQTLGDTFVRCHRSYLVNKERIEYIDFKDRMIHMMDGSGIPFSRSSRDDMHQLLQGGAAEG